MRPRDLLATLAHDLRFTLRGLRRSPGFTAVVLITLALGIGATTTIYSVVQGVLLRPLPYPAAEQLVRLWPGKADDATVHGRLSGEELRDWERELPAFTAVAGYGGLGGGRVFGDALEPTVVMTTVVSGEFFRVLGVPAALGRTLSPADHADGSDRNVVVSHAFWQRFLGGDARAVGRTIELDGTRYVVVGVMPPDFAFPSPDMAVWLSTHIVTENNVCCGRDGRYLEVVARLRPTATPADGQRQAAALLGRLAATYPQTNAGWTVANLQGLRASIVGSVERGLVILFGAVALVLLVACVNVANLVLVRGTTRARELAVRAALGADRARLLGLLLTESLVLAMAGGLLGVLLAWGGVRALVALTADFLPRAADVRVDGGVLLFALGLSVLTGLFCGLWPALRASLTARLGGMLREDTHGSVGGAHRTRSLLVTAEVALAVVLVVGAGLMVRSLQRLVSVDLGFRPEGTLLLRFSVPIDELADMREMGRLLVQQRLGIVERVRAIPGVTAVGATKYAPFTRGDGEPRPFVVPGRFEPPAGQEPRVTLHPASPGYLAAMGIPILAGEDVPDLSGDTTRAVVAVISKGMADRFWPGRSPVGESFRFANVNVRIVGVAGNVRNTRLDSLAGFTAYMPDRNMPRTSMSLLVRTAGEPMAIEGPVRAALRELHPRLAFEEVTPLDAKLREAAATPRLFTVLASAFGLLALTLAAIGLYGVVAYVMRQREREIAVRMALGAAPGRVQRDMLRHGLAPVVAGLAIGLAGALATTRVLTSLLFEVSATDPATYAAVLGLLAAVALLAAWLPARRAAQVQPMMILRGD